MPYEIPTETHYEERLLGPLTVKQSIYAAAAGSITIFMVFLAKDVHFLVRAVSTMASLGIAMGVIFFNLDEYVKNYILYIREERTVSWISPAASRLLGVKEVKANAAFLRNNNVIAILKIHPINFGVLNKEDQDIVIYNFLQFLNSLDFNIQIVMRSVNLDLTEYLDSLQRRIVQRDDQMSLVYFEHFSKYLEEYIAERKINDRLFYIMIPGRKSFDEKKIISDLETRCQVIIESLNRSGIIAERMDNKQILDFYSSYFTQTFHIGEDFISPVTMYKKIWEGERAGMKPPSIEPMEELEEPTVESKEEKPSEFKKAV